AVATPQDDTQATHAAKITKEEGVVDWTQPAARIHDLVRGLQPWPLAGATLTGLRLVLRATARHDGPVVRPDADPAPTPGTVVAITGDAIVVACGLRTELRILDVQPEGRRSMSVRDFLAGRSVTEGMRFGT